MKVPIGRLSAAAHYKLNNLTAIIDRNRLQSIEDTESTLRFEPLLRSSYPLIGKLRLLTDIITMNYMKVYQK